MRTSTVVDQLIAPMTTLSHHPRRRTYSTPPNAMPIWRRLRRWLRVVRQSVRSEFRNLRFRFPVWPWRRRVRTHLYAQLAVVRVILTVCFDVVKAVDLTQHLQRVELKIDGTDRHRFFLLAAFNSVEHLKLKLHVTPRFRHECSAFCFRHTFRCRLRAGAGRAGGCCWEGEGEPRWKGEQVKMKAIILNLSAWAVLPFMDTIA